MIEYSRNGDIIEVIIRDSSQRKIDSYKCNLKDKVKSGKIMRFLKDKYGFEPVIPESESINAEEEKEQEKIDWIGGKF